MSSCSIMVIMWGENVTAHIVNKHQTLTEFTHT
jgi:hypothetical protein